MSNDDSIRASVRQHYAATVKGSTGCCGPTTPSCCGPAVSPVELSRQVGYSSTEIAAVPDGANLGLGCGNPLAFAELRPGDVVVDLGSGAGFDAFIASPRVGPAGRVIGVDMTPEMIERSRALAARDHITNVEFRLGEIEALPVADAVADMVISNCVINLSPEKPRVFAEAFRVLKPGGVLMLSDLVLLRPLLERVRASVEAYVGCISGASLRDEYLAMISRAGFSNVEVLSEGTYPIGSSNPDETERVLMEASDMSIQDLRATAESVVSVRVRATKPTAGIVDPSLPAASA